MIGLNGGIVSDFMVLQVRLSWLFPGIQCSYTGIHVDRMGSTGDFMEFNGDRTEFYRDFMQFHGILYPNHMVA